ncbi:acyl-CoA dehydrogenase [Actinospica durhamensis]|uniref:Broad-specificity linear acyl-CoA dehydrogenase FadE5 n=1 Tax=Actinospica durhamensis TaxID=1508375 RepID=A0A941EKS8_9ACTN|nr:acyl-CoA dehydrogenase [Actinospica durhamensis]MBR7834275.1 acyl-CoA dehydrogenase [Actinospica durhamensis]
MSHYRSNLRDLEFNLFEVFDTREALGRGPYAEIDEPTARQMLAEVERLALGPIAASYTEADRNPPVYDPATCAVTMPEAFRRSYQAYMNAEWWRLDLPPELGGTPAPRALWWSLVELVQGAQAPVFMFGGGPSFSTLLHFLGTEEQRRMAKLMVERRWAATMVLTEPDAGSDVGAGTTRAVPQPDGTWHIQGVKRFITSGEHDLEENIVHFVLARPDGAGPGTKGLSLFVVPKYHFDPATGALGERNGVYATNVEKKMGIKVSTTCEMTFGQHEPAVGHLLGGVHDGIAQMFKVIEGARMQVGVKAIATLSTGYLNALDYARTRVQGPDLARAGDKTAPRVSIDQHPDVRVNLMTQKAYAEGLRALYIYTASWLDRAALARAVGNEAAAERATSVNDLLLPLVKGVGSERSYALLAQSLQTFGGSGFLQDYPLEQYIRDTKIDTLYEGTTGIQGLDFFFRKIARDREVAWNAVTGEIEAFLTETDGEARLRSEHAALSEALGHVRAMVAAMLDWQRAASATPAEIYKAGQNTTRLLMSVGDLILGWLLARQAHIALKALEAGPAPEERDFYTGKSAVARFFAATVLPELAARRAALEATDNALMDLDPAAFR